MNFIGVDLHKKSITLCVMDQNRKVLSRKTIACKETNEIVDFFRKFRPFKVVVEATSSYPWFVELVEPLADEVILANPKKLRRKARGSCGGPWWSRPGGWSAAARSKRLVKGVDRGPNHHRVEGSPVQDKASNGGQTRTEENETPVRASHQSSEGRWT